MGQFKAQTGTTIRGFTSISQQLIDNRIKHVTGKAPQEAADRKGC
jgi:hypothetical protein